MPKRYYRIPKAKPGELRIVFGKPDPWNNADVCYVNGPGAHHGDAALLHSYLGGDRPRLDLAGDKPKNTLLDYIAYDPSLLKELAARGYDLTTIKFSIQKKKKVNDEQGCNTKTDH